MKTAVLIIFITLHYQSGLCQKSKITKWFEEINTNVMKFDEEAADISWDSLTQPNKAGLPTKTDNYQKRRILWQQRTCARLAVLQSSQLLNITRMRQTYLLCRGPVYNLEEARKYTTLYEEIQSLYFNAKVCFRTKTLISKENANDIEHAIIDHLIITANAKSYLNHEIEALEDGNVLCLTGDSDFEKMISFSKNEDVLKWIWLKWREVGADIKRPYVKLVGIENAAAKRNGYTDIGTAWRDELEIPNLREFSRRLYSSIRPLYVLLHGVTRFYLRRQYGSVVPKRGPIPAHLLGSLWAQNWEPLIDLIIPRKINLDESMKDRNWTVTHMVKRVEDFYQSLGLPSMTDSFWRWSVFTKNETTRCHGTAADMVRPDDFRLLSCSDVTFKDFYVLHHEMGHIQYFMAYKHQPQIFRQGANSAFHESIGDAIMFSIMTPQHLHRLGLINDSMLYTTSAETLHYGSKDNNIKDEPDKKEIFRDETDAKNHLQNARSDFEEFDDSQATVDIVEEFSTDDILLLKQALSKIPQIPYSLLIDEYRWKLFEGNVDEGLMNEEFWRMVEELQGIGPPEDRGEKYFDIGAIFHVADNTPHARYFLSSFLQHQLFEELCKAAVFGRRHVKEGIPDSIPLNRCDIYGSKAAGKILKDLMAFGSSQHWRKVLFMTTGQHTISAEPILRYYSRLYRLLAKMVKLHQIPLGW